MLSRRTLLRCSAASALALAGGGQFAAADTESAERARRIAWLEANAAPLRSLEPAETDFSDLEPFGKAVGNARMVMLGEQSHGDGATFRAKTRLIRFLHEHMGFDVLAFESGFYDVHKVWELLLAGGDVLNTVRRGIYSVWSRSAEAGPLFDYIGQRLRSSRPLELAGFDFRIPYIRDSFLDDLLAFLGTRGIDGKTLVDWPRFVSLINNFDALINLDTLGDNTWSWGRDEVRFLEEAFERLSASFAAAIDRDAKSWRQVLSLAKARTYERSHAGTKSDFDRYVAELINRRDHAMGNSLVWLAREGHPTRRIIVWAATGHTMRTPQEIGGEFVSMGHWAWQALGSDIFNVAFTSCQGEYGWFSEETSHAIEPPPADSLEGLWAASSRQDGFLDLRAASEASQWLRTPLLGRIAGPQGFARVDWTRIVDALVFIRTMTRSTRVT